MLEKLPDRVGEALRERRAGLEQTVLHRLNGAHRLLPLSLRSAAFEDGWAIPVKYTADGSGISPPLQWSGVPDNAASVVLIVEDADSPTPHPLVHAIVVNLDTTTLSLAEGALDSPKHAGMGLTVGRNSYLSKAWLPPDPPPGHGAHRYCFQVFALHGPRLSGAPGRTEAFKAIAERGVAAGQLIGTYERPKK